MIKKRRQRCERHKATGRSWSEYVFGFIDHSGIEVWRCAQCKESSEKWLANYERRQAEKIESYKRALRESFEKDKQIKIKRKQELWDSYVFDEFRKGLKNPNHHFIETPSKEVIQLIRATMQLQRLIKDIKKGNIKTKKQVQKEKLEEEQVRLNGILVQCKIHGPLKLKDVIKGGKSRWTGEQRYKCRQCMSDTHRDYYKRNKDYLANKHAQYRKNNPEKVKETKAKSWRKQHGKNNEHDNAKEQSSRNI